MATETKKSFNIGNALAEGMMAFGDGMQGIYGQRGNTYATYLDAQTKRQALEVENQKYQQTLAQQQFENTLNQSKQVQSLYEKQQDSIMNYAKQGMRPVDPMQAMSASGRMPTRMTQGAYGQSYVPSPSMATTPIFGVGEGGTIQQMGAMPKGGKFVSPMSMTGPQQRADIQINTAVTKDQSIRNEKLKGLTEAIDFFEEKINEIPSGSGVSGRLKGVGTAISGSIQSDPKAAAYMANISGMRSQIARGLGEVGNLSETEQKYAIKLLPQITDNMETRQAKIKNFRDYISKKTTSSAKPTKDSLGLFS